MGENIVGKMSQHRLTQHKILCLTALTQIPHYLEVLETRKIQICQEAHQNARTSDTRHAVKQN